MIGTDFKEFDDATFSRFRRRLLRTKGSAEQRAFLAAVRNGTDFARVIRDELMTHGSVDQGLSPEALTENEFKQPPRSTEMELYGAWSGLTPRIACRTTFWANLTFRHIENGRIQSSYLAANGGNAGSGAERIDKVLQESGDGAAGLIDKCVRTVLRRLGGLPEARGNKSVYVDCPLARAWWRERVVNEVADGDLERAKRVREVTRLKQTYWEELVVLVVSRNSVLGSREVRDKLILSLAGVSRPLLTTKNLRATCRVVGALQASRELSILGERELQDLMDQVVRLHHSQEGPVGGSR